MRRPLVVGIMRETTHDTERRTPLTPKDVRWLISKGIEVEVQSSSQRVFGDSQYHKAGARIVNNFRKASLLLGIKRQEAQDLSRGKIYMMFSHTIKGQKRNISYLKEMVKRKITFIDYEKIIDTSGKRLVYFGRFAGICGMIDSLFYLGKRLESKGIRNPFGLLKPAYEFKSLQEAKEKMAEVRRVIRKQAIDRAISPFIIGVTGHGNVSRGAQEILDLLNPIEVHPRDMHKFIKHQKYVHNRIYKIVLFREEKLRAKKGRAFYFEEYLKNPERFESNLDMYLPYFNILVNGSYWDKRFPRLVTEKMIQKSYRRKDFRLEFIGDISCDIKGSIEITKKTTTSDNPAFTYDPTTGKITDGYRAEGITVLAIDNLPSQLPKDSSEEFSHLVRDYVYQIAAHGAMDIINHAALPREIREAVVLQGGKLTKPHTYLWKYLR